MPSPSGTVGLDACALWLKQCLHLIIMDCIVMVILYGYRFKRNYFYLTVVLLLGTNIRDSMY